MLRWFKSYPAQVIYFLNKKKEKGMSDSKKAIYYTIKLIVCGGGVYQSISFVYFRYGKKISRQKLKSILVKVGLVSLGTNIGIIGFVGKFCRPSTCRRLKNVGRMVVNLSLMPYTGTARVADLGLGGIELLVFGERLPVVDRFFLLGFS